ncbi:MAG: TRAP transporter small permease [Methylobacteriaceae bacterium]|nr:TRAP transporter small permease [Methylobacteriaceae bacterium]
MRRILDAIYRAALWAAALCLLAIAVLVLAQVGGRVLDTALKAAGRAPLGFQILSLSEIAGFLLAGASFLALGPTLKAGGHIRVTMFLAMLGAGGRRAVETLAALFGLVCALYLTWHMAALALESWRFNELSIGLMPIPLVWPQIPLGLGAVVLAIALVDELAILVSRGDFSFRLAEDAATLGKEG